jgi:hypothetical protein
MLGYLDRTAMGCRGKSCGPVTGKKFWGGMCRKINKIDPSRGLPLNPGSFFAAMVLVPFIYPLTGMRFSWDAKMAP